MAASVRFQFHCAWARLLRGAKTTVTAADPSDPTHRYLRCRRWYATPMIVLGNVYMRWLGVGVTFLHCQAWARWESAVHAALGTCSSVNKTGVTIPRLSGMTVAAALPGDREQALVAAEASLRSLAAAHQLAVPWPDGIDRPFSHGDATVVNVIYDPVTGVATWIDFETLHDPRLSVEHRRADDLRAWLCSAVEYGGMKMADELIPIVVRVYDDAPVLEELQRMLLTSRDNVYHLAQGMIGRELRLELAGMLKQERSTR